MLEIFEAPQAHKVSHQNNGSDEIVVTGLSDVLADDQHVIDAEVQELIDVHSALADPHTGYVLESLFNAQTIIYATSDNTPVALTVPEQRIVGRITDGDIDALTGAETLSILSGQAGATFDWNGESLSGIATITSGNITILGATPILVFKDSNSLGAASVGFIEWRDSGGGRAGFFGNSSSGNDDLLWKNEQSGNIGIQTTGAGTIELIGDTNVTGAITVGDGGVTNYTQFSRSGDMTMYGTADTIDTIDKDLLIDCGTEKTLKLIVPVFDDVQFGISNAKVPASNAPTWQTFTTNTKEYGFGVNDFIDCEANELPHPWVEESSARPHLHVTTKAANTSGSSQYAKFTVYIANANSEGVSGEQWVETSFTAELTIVNGIVALGSLHLDMGSDLTLTNYVIGTQVKVRIERIAATGGTEYPGEIFITQVGLHISNDTIGSRQLLVK